MGQQERDEKIAAIEKRAESFARGSMSVTVAPLLEDMAWLVGELQGARNDALQEAADIADAAREEVADARQIRDRILALVE